MQKVLVLGLLTLVFGGATKPQPHAHIPQKKKNAEAAVIISGNAIYKICEVGYKIDKTKGPGCLMYIAGVAQTLILNDDTAMMTGPCPGAQVTEEQITDVVLKWLDDHPEKRHLPAPYLVMTALKEAFPCD